MSFDLPIWHPNNFVETCMGEIVELKYGKALRDYKDKTQGYPVYGTNGKVGFCDKALCDFAGIIVGRKGAYRGVHYSDEPFYVIDTAYYVYPKYDINLKWLYYELLTQDINGLDSGSAIPSTRREDFYALRVKVPPRFIQDKICESLDCFNKNILTNKSINELLEQIAHTIFKSWFVNFEPTKAKISAREALLAENPAATPEQIATTEQQAAIHAISGAGDIIPTEQLQTIADLFPNQLVESELGEIPEGWFTKTIEQICLLASGKVETVGLTTDTYVSTENMVENRGGLRQASSLPTSKTVSEFKEGDTLVSNIRPYFKKIWLASYDGGRSNDVLCFRAINPDTSEFLYCLLNRDEFFDFMMQTSKGAKMPRGDKQAIMAKTEVVPDSDLQKYFSKIVRSFFNLTVANNKQNKSLIMLREILLPKLLSGEIVAA